MILIVLMNMTLRMFAALLLLAALLGGESATIPRRCTYTIRARSSARNEFQETKTTVIIPRCSTNGITWNKPHYPHIITFFRRFKPFLLCLQTLTSGVAVYRLKGTSRQLVAASNNTGNVACLESECKQVNLLLEPDSGGSVINRAHYTYSYSEVKIFIGKLLRSKYDGIKAYTLYFQLAEYIKYNNSYNEHSNDFILPHPDQLQCTTERNITSYIKSYNAEDVASNNVHTTTNRYRPTNPNSLHDVRIRPPGFLPSYGLIKIYSKCALEVEKIYLISGHVGMLSVARRFRERFVLCCAEEDESYAASQLESLLHRQECCRYH